MRILYVLNETSPQGGSVKSFLTLLKGVIEAGHEVAVAMPDTDGVYKQIKEYGAQVFVAGFRPQTYPVIYNALSYIIFIPLLLSFWLRNAISYHKLYKKTKEFKPDIIHTNSSIIGIGFALSRKISVPHIYHIREYGDLDFRYYYFPTKKAFRKQLADNKSYNICITKGVQRHMRQDENQNSHVIYNGIIGEAPDAMPCTQHKYFLYAGRIERAKGVSDLVDAYIAYTKKHDNPLPLMIAGNESEPAYADAIRKKVIQEGLTKQIVFLGTRNDMEHLYSEAIAIVIPSLNEGFGRCMPEAMSHGVLAIGRNSGGTREQMDNGVAHTDGEIALRFNTTEELTEHLLNVTRDSSIYEQMRMRAYKTVANLYSAKAYTQRVTELYSQILSQ